MTSKLRSAVGTRLPSKRFMMIGLVAVMLLFAGCSGGGDGEGEQGTTVITEEGGAETTVLEVEEGGEGEEGTTIVTEEGGAETTIVTEEGTEMGTEMGTQMGTQMTTEA